MQTIKPKNIKMISTNTYKTELNNNLNFSKKKDKERE